MKHAEWQSTDRDVAHYYLEIALRGAALFASLAFCALGGVGVWFPILANVLLYPGVYLRVHDVGHGVPVARYGWLARFIPVANPIWGGTRVFAQVHKEHHSHFGTDRDPWLPYYTGHPLRALFFNLIEPEYSFAKFIGRRGWDRELALNVLFNIGLFALGSFIFGGLYLVFVITQRLVHMTGIFFFNFYTHRETFSASAPIGTWEREANLRGVLPLLRLAWGTHVIDGLIYHNRHHCIGQAHVPVQNYKRLADTGFVSRFHSQWPIHEIIALAPAPATASLGARSGLIERERPGHDAAEEIECR